MNREDGPLTRGGWRKLVAASSVVLPLVFYTGVTWREIAEISVANETLAQALKEHRSHPRFHQNLVTETRLQRDQDERVNRELEILRGKAENIERTVIRIETKLESATPKDVLEFLRQRYPEVD